jgi:hypothetical protein
MPVWASTGSRVSQEASFCAHGKLRSVVYRLECLAAARPGGWRPFLEARDSSRRLEFGTGLPGDTRREQMRRSRRAWLIPGVAGGAERR